MNHPDAKDDPNDVQRILLKELVASYRRRNQYLIRSGRVRGSVL